jgi:hypothetical protein
MEYVLCVLLGWMLVCSTVSGSWYKCDSFLYNIILRMLLALFCVEVPPLQESYPLKGPRGTV